MTGNLCFAAGNPEASSSGRSSLQTVSQTDPSNHLSMAVLVNSAASSRHHTTGGSGPTSRLGQLSRAATSETEGVETGRLLLNAPNGAGAGRSQSVPNRAGQAAIGPNDLAAVSHADGGNRSHSIVSGQGPLKPHAVEMDTHMGMDTTACSNHDGDNADAHQRAAQTSPLQLPSVDPAAHAADSAVSVETLANSQEEHTCHGSELQHSQHSLSGSAIMAQLPRFAKADSGKSASEIILSPLSSAGRHSETVSRAESDAARVSGHPDAALGQQAQPEGSSLQVPLAVGSAPQGMPEDVPQRAIELPLASEQTGAGPGAGPAEAQGQPQAALGTALSMSQAEQRNVEEQEVLYNMTGQTGSLMYMAPEVIQCLC